MVILHIMPKHGGTNIWVSEGLKRRLEEKKAPRQPIGGFIEELFSYWLDSKPESK